MKKTAKSRIFLAVCVFFAALGAKNIFAQGPGWFFEPGTSYTHINGMDLRVGFFDPTGGGEPQGSVLMIETDYKLAPQLRGGYIFSDDSRLTFSFAQYNQEPSFYFDTATGSIWDLHISGLYMGFDYSAVTASNTIELMIIDADYTFPLFKSPKWFFEMTTGLRYANLKNKLHILYQGSVFDVDVNNEFGSEMYGPKIGFTAKTNPDNKLGFYASGMFCLLVGNTDTSSFQVDDTAYVIANFGEFNQFSVQQFMEAEVGLTYSIVENFLARLFYRAGVWNSAVRQISYPDDSWWTVYDVEKFNLVFSSIGLSVVLTFG